MDSSRWDSEQVRAERNVFWASVTGKRCRGLGGGVSWKEAAEGGVKGAVGREGGRRVENHSLPPSLTSSREAD